MLFSMPNFRDPESFHAALLSSVIVRKGARTWRIHKLESYEPGLVVVWCTSSHSHFIPLCDHTELPPKKEEMV
jgi:hypothetical protein